MPDSMGESVISARPASTNMYLGRILQDPHVNLGRGAVKQTSTRSADLRMVVWCVRLVEGDVC